MILSEHLTPVLKKLRLSGILDTLDLRHRQAVEGNLDYAEFLMRLLADEVERRESKQLALRPLDPVARRRAQRASLWPGLLRRAPADLVEVRVRGRERRVDRLRVPAAPPGPLLGVVMKPASLATLRAGPSSTALVGELDVDPLAADVEVDGPGRLDPEEGPGGTSTAA